VSSPADELAEASRTLLGKADDDAAAARELAANPDISDEIVGFHAQQAVEKWLKALIADSGRQFEHTHDLRRLLTLARADRSALPVNADALIALTQYSVPLRYEDLLDVEPLDRDEAMTLIDALGRWAKSELEGNSANT
jgi:HEPN domain-containing protein